jgi:hypothetical protein
MWELERILRVFNKMASGDVVTWNAMIGTSATRARTPGCISPNATGRYTTGLCLHCRGSECMCQCGCS